VCNGYSRAVLAAAVLLHRPLVVFHQGYQLICSDGLGFRDRSFHGFETRADLRLAFAAGAKEGRSRATDGMSASQMPEKIARSDPLLVAVSTSRLSCKRAGKTRTLMPFGIHLENLG